VGTHTPQTTRRLFSSSTPIKPFISDFACFQHKLIIELDGDSHIGHETYDEERTDYLEAQGWTIIRFWNGEIYDEIEAVIARIMKQLKG
jgi:very-short-patch-repair endonuclease